MLSGSKWRTDPRTGLAVANAHPEAIAPRRYRHAGASVSANATARVLAVANDLAVDNGSPRPPG